jgi:hypothetical protein
MIVTGELLAGEDRLLPRRGWLSIPLPPGDRERPGVWLITSRDSFCRYRIEAVPNQSTLFLMKVGTSRSSKQKSLELLFE